VTPPAKKATPSALSDLLSKDKDKKDETVVEENKQDEIPVVEEDKEEEFDRDEDYADEKENDTFLSPAVVSTVPNKTPAELSAETPDETAARYGLDTSITDEDADNPRVQAYKDTVVRQVPSGTHLHPDVAKDLQNRGISQHTTDSAQVKREVTETYDFAESSEFNDKF
jgi:hypothetical protein